VAVASRGAVDRTGHGGAGRKGRSGHGDPSDSAVSRDRLESWGRELRLVHRELRTRIELLRDQVLRGETVGETDIYLTQELRLFCLGFCGALTSHHAAEDTRLFPHVVAAHPGLSSVVDRLMEDHRMLAALIKDLDRVTRTASAAQVLSHLDGIMAIMESHFGYEERQLTAVLDALTAPDPAIRSLL
jgi:hemerythrin-like domain-containing protein